MGTRVLIEASAWAMNTKKWGGGGGARTKRKTNERCALCMKNRMEVRRTKGDRFSEDKTEPEVVVPAINAQGKKKKFPTTKKKKREQRDGERVGSTKGA